MENDACVITKNKFFKMVQPHHKTNLNDSTICPSLTCSKYVYTQKLEGHTRNGRRFQIQTSTKVHTSFLTAFNKPYNYFIPNLVVAGDLVFSSRTSELLINKYI